jgi:methyltransferase
MFEHNAEPTMLVAVFVIVFGSMLVETRRAGRNERAQRARGGLEPRDDIYNVMRVVYPAAFLAMMAEGAWRGLSPGPFAAGALLFAAAKALKWWAILSLGPFWTFRVIVVPGTTLVVNGPYRWLRHPNYVAVVGELVAVALMSGAVVTGPMATAVFAVILVRRIAVETNALSSGV